MTTQLDFNSANLKALFRENAEGTHKHQQVFAYIIQIKAAFSKLSTKRPIVLLDCGCGKSYLSFILYEYCRTNLKKEPRIIGIDNNADLISKCKKTAAELQFKNMEFYHSNIEEFKTDEPIDIVYSLHACDTATDQTIAKGATLGAKYIFSVSCCQHTNRKNMSKHPLHSITRHQQYKERLVDMVGDSMRALLLEHLGYGVKLFEFVAAEYTPKNIMLRAIKSTVKKQDQETAKDNYNKLVAMFNFSSPLENFLKIPQ